MNVLSCVLRSCYADEEIFSIRKTNPMMFTKQQQIHLWECQMPNYHHICTQDTSSSCDDGTERANPLANQPGSQTLVLWGAVDGFINVLADACPRLSLSAVKIGCGSTRSWRSHTADRRARALSHTPHAHTDARFYCISASAGMNIKIGCLEWVVCVPSNLLLSSNQGKTLTLMASQVGGDLRRKLCCISQSDALSSLDGGLHIREHNGGLT